jgi:MFS family permease
MMKNDRQSNLKRNIWKFYLLQILEGMMFFLPVIVLFWQNNGLSLTEVMILQSLYSIVVVILEVPTGYFADMFGRKKSLVLASLFTTVGIITYIMGFNFYQFLIAEIFWAFGVSLVSGTDSAFIYDTLKDLGKEKSYKRIWGNSRFYYLIALSIASIIGGFIGEINLRWTFYAMLPAMLIMIPLTLSLTEPKRHKMILKKDYTHTLFSIIRTYLIRNKKIRWLIVYSSVIVGFNSAVLFLYQPYFLLTGLDIFHFGLIFAAFNIVAALSSKYAYRLEKRLGQRYSLMMLFVLTGGSYLLMSNFIFLFSFSFAFIQQFVRGFSDPIITDYINKLTPSEIRATVLSADRLITSLFYALIIPFIGFIADVYSLTQALTVLGVTTIAVGIPVVLILKKDKVI